MRSYMSFIVYMFLLAQYREHVDAQRGPRYLPSFTQQPESRGLSTSDAVVAPGPSPLSAAVNESLASRGNESPRNIPSRILGALLTDVSEAGRRVPFPVVGTFSLDAANGTIGYIISGLRNARPLVFGGVYRRPVESQRGANETAGRLVARLQEQQRYGNVLTGAVRTATEDVAGILTDMSRYQIEITTANGSVYRGDLTRNASSLLGLPSSFVLNATNELRALRRFLGLGSPPSTVSTTTGRILHLKNESRNHVNGEIEHVASPDAHSSTRHQSTDPQQNSVSTQPSPSSGTQLPPSSANAAATALPSGIVPNQARPVDVLPSPTSPSLATALMGVVSALGSDGGGSGLTSSSSQGTDVVETIISALLGAAVGNAAGASTTPPSSATSELQNLVAQGLASYLEGQLGIRNTNPTSGGGTRNTNTNSLLATIINTVANANGLSGSTAAPVTVGSPSRTSQSNGASSNNPGGNLAGLLGAGLGALGNLGAQLPPATPSAVPTPRGSGSDTGFGGSELSQLLNSASGLYGETPSSSLAGGGRALNP